MTTRLIIDREVEGQRMSAEIARLIPDPDAGHRLFANVRDICAPRWKHSPNWVLAMSLYGTGSTYAFAVCRRIGVDPDAQTSDRVGSHMPAASDVLTRALESALPPGRSLRDRIAFLVCDLSEEHLTYEPDLGICNAGIVGFKVADILVALMPAAGTAKPEDRS